MNVTVPYLESILVMVKLQCDQRGQQKTIENFAVFHEFSLIENSV